MRDVRQQKMHQNSAIEKLTNFERVCFCTYTFHIFYTFYKRFEYPIFWCQKFNKTLRDQANTRDFRQHKIALQ